MIQRLILVLFICLTTIHHSHAYYDAPMTNSFNKFLGKTVYIQHTLSTGWLCTEAGGPKFEKCPNMLAGEFDYWQTPMIVKQIYIDDQVHYVLASKHPLHEKSFCASTSPISNLLEACATSGSQLYGTQQDSNFTSLFFLEGDSLGFKIYTDSTKTKRACSSNLLYEWSIFECTQPGIGESDEFSMEIVSDNTGLIHEPLGPGTIVLFKGDRLVYNNYELNIINVIDEPGTDDDYIYFEVTANTESNDLGRYIRFNGFKYSKMRISDNVTKNEYISAHGAFIRIDSIAGNNVTVQIEDSGEELYNHCNQNYPTSGFCEFLGWYESIGNNSFPKNPVLNYGDYGQIKTSYWPGYSKYSNLLAANAINCLGEVENITKVIPKSPIFFHITVDPDPNSTVGCSRAAYNNRVYCAAKLEWSDHSITNGQDPDVVTKYNRLVHWIKDNGKCMDMHDTPSSAVLHETIHEYGGMNFPNLNEYSNEGLATFFTDQFVDVIAETYQDVWIYSGLNKRLCYPTGYATQLVPLPPLNYHSFGYSSMSPPPNPYPYEHRPTGECLYKDLKAAQPPANFTKIFKYGASLSDGCRDLKATTENWKFFEDWMDPILGGDNFNIYKNKYNIDVLGDPSQNWDCSRPF
jgi:hypothetical protein